MMAANHNSTAHNTDSDKATANAGQQSRLRLIVISTLILLPGLALFISAGLWQLGRAEEKRILLDTFVQADKTPLTGIPESKDRAEELLFRRFSLSGSYRADQQILLDNMVSDGVVGFQVLTPLELPDGRIVLINRGWVAGERGRGMLPYVEVSDEPRTVTGRLAFLPEPGIRMDTPAESSAGEAWPRRMTWPQAADIAAALGLSDAAALQDWQLLLDADAPDGYARDWQPETMGPETHLGYAVQWFSFAALALIIYTLFHLRWSRRK